MGDLQAVRHVIWAHEFAASAMARAEVPKVEDWPGQKAASGSIFSHIQAPLTEAERQAWRDRVGGCWKWSEAR